MVHTEQLRDWNPPNGLPTLGLSEQRASSQDTPLDGRKTKILEYQKMKKIALAAVAALAITGS
ncbi:hypothetical protein, partial [Mesorhizobium sp.]|uniref:hypothetical protein n=1 Tax=Mesorhizobium sp. TaxID=1871066 RepID=UPI0025F7503C